MVAKAWSRTLHLLIQEMQRWQETIVNHEQQLLLDIAFDMTIEHPFAFMVDLAERYIVSPQARELAWIAIVDSYETILLLRYSAIAVAGAALFAVCEFLKEKLGNWGDKPIWDVVREMEGEGSTVTELTIRSVAREIHQACKVLLKTAGATLKPVSLPNEGRGVSHQPRAAPLGMVSLVRAQLPGTKTDSLSRFFRTHLLPVDPVK
jgi:hypothetical protein